MSKDQNAAKEQSEEDLGSKHARKRDQHVERPWDGSMASVSKERQGQGGQEMLRDEIRVWKVGVHKS